MANWDRYYDEVSNEPSPWVVSSLPKLQGPRTCAADLGAGTLRNTKYLRQQGFGAVTAIDLSARIFRFTLEAGDDHINSVQTDVVAYHPWPDSLDMVVSMNTLWFVAPYGVREVLRSVHKGLRRGGLFAFNVMGPKDGWVERGRADIFVFEREEVEQLCAAYSLLELEEEEVHLPPAGTTIPKLWHTWSVLLQK